MKRFGILLGALIAAVAASACCILPLILGAASAGTVGFGAALAPYRPYLMGLTLVLLGVGFYFAYRPARASANEADCCTPGAKRLQRFNSGLLWVVAAFTLAAMAYPWFAARRADFEGSSSRRVAATPASAQTAVFTIGKMYCADCAVKIAGALRKTPGGLRCFRRIRF